MKKVNTPIVNAAGKLSIALSLALLIGLTSCDKDEDDLPNGNSNNNQTDNPQLGAGTLVAIKSESVQSTPMGDMTINIGTAVAVFGSDANFSSFVDAGTVSINGQNLSKAGNHAYTFTPSMTEPTGIEFGNAVNWSVSGNDANGVPAFDHNMSGGFPTVGRVNVDEELSKSESLTLPISGVSNADSLVVNVNEAVKTVAAGVNAVNFSSDELSGISKGTGIVSIAGVRYTSQAYGGKEFFFLTQTVKQKTVTITD